MPYRRRESPIFSYSRSADDPQCDIVLCSQYEYASDSNGDDASIGDRGADPAGDMRNRLDLGVREGKPAPCPPPSAPSQVTL